MTLTTEDGVAIASLYLAASERGYTLQQTGEFLAWYYAHKEDVKTDAQKYKYVSELPPHINSGVAMLWFYPDEEFPNREISDTAKSANGNQGRNRSGETYVRTATLPGNIHLQLENT